MKKALPCLLLSAMACLLFVSVARADDPEHFDAAEPDSSYTASLYIVEDKEMLDQIKFGAHAEQMREWCPLCAFLADNSDNYIWLPMIIEWREGVDLAAFNMNCWARIGKRWYKMRDMILPIQKAGKMDFVRLDDVNRLAPGRYPGVPQAGEADPNKAQALLSFKRTKRFKIKEIEEIQFTADKEARPLQK